MKKDSKNIVNFLFEVGILAKTPRSGFHFLGSGEQSVAEHTHRTVYVGFVLAKLEGDVDAEKVLKMCLFHDLAEARTSDLNYVHQKYAISNEHKAIKDLSDTLEFGEEMIKLLFEYKEKKTKEAKLAKDADQLELVLSLKEEIDTGNSRAKSWLPSALKRLNTKVAKNLAKKIIKTDSDEWWLGDKNDPYWVTKNIEGNKNRF